MKRILIVAAICCVSSALWAQQSKVQVIEEIIARVNTEIITLSKYQTAEETLADEAKQECSGCSPQQLQEMIDDHHVNLLRDLIDQSLLAQKGKDLGINVEVDVIKRLDQIRQQYNWKDMDEMETQMRAQGMSMEDYKQQLRDDFLTREVIRREVSSHIQVSHEDIENYYKEHQDEFNRPEYVVLSEFFLSTEKKSEADVPAIEAKANSYLARIRRGESFEELAKRYSESNTAKDGGYLGSFQRGQLSKEIEDAVFKLKRNETTDVIRTKTGFLILQLTQHYDAGIQPLDKVRAEIENRLIFQRTQPELRKYVATLREESYVVVKPGYTDTAAVEGTSIVEVDPAAAAPKSEKKSTKKSGPAAAQKQAAPAPAPPAAATPPPPGLPAGTTPPGTPAPGTQPQGTQPQGTQPQPQGAQGGATQPQ
jgi:peptidyl-prolyl cis-trans isomerase SurA